MVLYDDLSNKALFDGKPRVDSGDKFCFDSTYTPNGVEKRRGGDYWHVDERDPRWRKKVADLNSVVNFSYSFRKEDRTDEHLYSQKVSMPNKRDF